MPAANPPLGHVQLVSRRMVRWLRYPFAMLLVMVLALPPSLALAHNQTDAPGVRTLWTWEFDPFVLLPLGYGAALFVWLVRRVNAEHPHARVPTRRIVWFGLSMAVFVIAVASPIAVYDDDLFSDHMVQHMLLMMVMPPFLLLSGPMTLVLRAAPPRVRRDWLLPLLHSRLLRLLLFPVFTWLAFTLTLYVTHFTGFYDAAVENIWIHRLEHLLYVGVALLFWWPVVQVDPGPWRISHPLRILYLLLAMSQTIFVGLILYSASSPLYSSYTLVARTWGPSVLLDQQLGGAIMWVMGAMIFVGAIILVAFDWMGTEQRMTERRERLQTIGRNGAQTPEPKGDPGVQP